MTMSILTQILVLSAALLIHSGVEGQYSWRRSHSFSGQRLQASSRRQPAASQPGTYFQQGSQQGRSCSKCIQVVSSYSLAGLDQSVQDEFTERLREKAPRIRASEGNLAFNLYKETDADDFVGLEMWQSEAALSKSGMTFIVRDFVDFLTRNSIPITLKVYKLVL